MEASERPVDRGREASSARRLQHQLEVNQSENDRAAQAVVIDQYNAGDAAPGDLVRELPRARRPEPIGQCLGGRHGYPRPRGQALRESVAASRFDTVDPNVDVLCRQARADDATTPSDRDDQRVQLRPAAGGVIDELQALAVPCPMTTSGWS